MLLRQQVYGSICCQHDDGTFTPCDALHRCTRTAIPLDTLASLYELLTGG